MFKYLLKSKLFAAPLSKRVVVAAVAVTTAAVVTDDKSAAEKKKETPIVVAAATVPVAAVAPVVGAGTAATPAAAAGAGAGAGTTVTVTTVPAPASASSSSSSSTPAKKDATVEVAVAVAADPSKPTAGVAVVGVTAEEKRVTDLKTASESVETPEGVVFLRTLPRLLPRLFQTYARPMAYASEVGESLRHVVPYLVKPMYALSWLYVIADTGLKTYEFDKALTSNEIRAIAGAGGKPLTAAERFEKIAYKFGDTFAWHSIASMAIPAFTVNRAVHFSSLLATRYLPNHPRLARVLPPLAALSLIPMVIHPIDHATDWVFDRSVRRWYADKVTLPKTDEEKKKEEAAAAAAAAVGGAPASKKH